MTPERGPAGRFRVDALAAIDAIVARGRLPLLVGGTGLYFRSLEAGIADLPAADPSVRRRLHAELDAFGSAHLHARLASVDPAAARRIHRNDPQRLVRALEVHALTGQSISELWQGRASAPLSRPIVKIIVAPAERAVLHRRLAARFEAMLERGFVKGEYLVPKPPRLRFNLPGLSPLLPLGGDPKQLGADSTIS